MPKRSTSAAPSGTKKAATVRGRRSTETVRHLITSAAREVFAEHGFDGATTREIARRAGTTTVMLFRHFGSKEQLFQQAVFEPFEQYVHERVQTVMENPGQISESSTFREYLGGMCKLFSENRGLLQALLSGNNTGSERASLANSQSLQNYLADTEQSLDKLDLKPGIDADLAARFSFALILATTLFQDWLFKSDDSKVEQSRRLDNLTQFVIGGVYGTHNIDQK